MKVIILAAGVGSRLYPLTADRPKCLLRLGNTTLLQHQIFLLNKLGIPNNQICIITGYKNGVLRKEIIGDFHYIYNSKYHITNNIVSLHLASMWALDSNSVLIINSDTLFGIEILKSIIETNLENAAVIDNVKSLGEEEMKVYIQRGLVSAFGKELNPEVSQGEYIGIAKFGGYGLSLLFRVLEEIINKNKIHEWYESAFNELIKCVPIFPIYTEGLPWIEIDTLADYENAHLIYKQIRLLEKW